MAKRIKVGSKPPKTPKIDTSFDFGANVTKSGKRKRTRKSAKGGGS